VNKGLLTINIMNLTSRIGILLSIVMLFIILLPALIGTDVVGLMEDDEFPDDDFSVVATFPIAWTRIPVYQMSVLLRLGISIFALVIVYLGGRSKDKRFNDRTIELVNFLISVFSRTALLRAVFNFLFFDIHRDHANNALINVFLPNVNSHTRRYHAMIRSIVGSSMKFQIQGGTKR
jgi:hypothetical protein